MADLTLTDQQQVPLTANPLNADGSAFTGTESFVWTLTGDGGTLPGASAAASVTFVSAGPFPEGETHNAVIGVTDAFGLSASFSIDVSGTEVTPPTSLTITAGTPEPKP